MNYAVEPSEAVGMTARRLERIRPAMQAYIADNPKGKYGVHEYTPEQYGIAPDAVRQDFHNYIGRFDLRPE